MEGQLTVQHGTLVGIQETVTTSAQGFREMNEGLGNLQQEILSDLRRPTAHAHRSHEAKNQDTPSTRTESPEGFSLKDRPTSTPAPLKPV